LPNDPLMFILNIYRFAARSVALELTGWGKPKNRTPKSEFPI